MRKFVKLSIFVVVLIGFMAPVLYSQTAIIKVVGVSPRDVADRGFPTTSSGLTTVGQGEMLFLMGRGAPGDTVTSYTWSLESVPAGSQKGLDSTDTKWTTFVPDTTGHFVVKLEITTNTGVADTTVTITSAHYTGVGGSIIDSRLPAPDFAKGQCAVCHSSKVNEWSGTGHASMLKRGLAGDLGSYYGSGCISCHTVGNNNFLSAVNGGFDDVAAALGWVFPSSLVPANWDTLVTDFPDLAQMANIQCENCHGPGSLHLGAKDKIDVSLDVGNCARCHDSGTHHVYPLQWRNAGHSKAVSEHAASSESCGVCHSSYGFVKAVSPTGDSEQRGTGLGEITCAACHDPHSAENEHQIRTMADVTLGNGDVINTGSLGKLCMNCHKSRRDAKTYAEAYHRYYGPHYGPQTDMLFGTNAITFGIHIPSSTHSKVIEETCVTCHMAATPGNGEPGQDMVGEHTFAMEWVDPITGEEVQNVAGCKGCHGEVESFDDFMAKADYDRDGVIESAQHEIVGLLDEVGKLLPPYDDPAVVVTQDYTPVELKAAYNYKFVKDDRSKGVHNFQYALNLLRVSHAALTTGDLGSAPISGITDVPNDQGKQVHLSWNRFGGDGVGAIEYYGMWRKVDEMSLGKSKGIPVYESFEKIASIEPAKLEGTRVMMDMDLWDFVGMVPAVGLDIYSAVVPTLFDSTADGMHWSYFVVSGHTANPANFMVTEPDSGYSIDNLAPEAPAGLSAAETADGVVLSWEDSIDEDVKYYAVYRGTEANFDPTGTEPLKETAETSFVDADVTVNNTYYYKVSGIDFSGNEGELSKEISLLITSVASGLNAIPEDFSLLQNFPNPFNPSTEITFGLPQEDYVKVTIFNVLGVKVRTLAEGTYGAGFHRFVWDANDDFGKQVAPGMYIYRLESSSQNITRKMILLK